MIRNDKNKPWLEKRKTELINKFKAISFGWGEGERRLTNLKLTQSRKRKKTQLYKIITQGKIIDYIKRWKST